MASKLLKISPHEAVNQLELTLRQAFHELEPKLRPPFSLEIPNAHEYSQLNKAILYGVLTEPSFARTHIKHLHAIVTDGYALFVGLIMKIVIDLYGKLVGLVKEQVIWVVKKMVDVLGVGFDGLLVCLLRQIVGGDTSDGNLWLCFELVTLFLGKWNCLLEEEPLVLTSALYVYLRQLADHCRVSSNKKLDPLKQLEIEFCVKMLREQLYLCMKIGRDLIRLLQDLAHIPEFRAIWKDLLLNPDQFRTKEFNDISQLYSTRTSSQYFLLRISPEMEAQLRFLLVHVKFGSQKRYQAWFAKKFLTGPQRETIIVDIVRFICCAHHPSNQIIQSDIIPRWAVIGWLLKSCRKNHIEASVKLALFYDWLFFDEKVDNIMNVEPALLLMVFSIPQYVDLTHTLLDFLLLLADNYDVDRTHVIIRGLSSAFNALVQKGVVHSLDVLTLSDALSSLLKERLGKLLCLNASVRDEHTLADLPRHPATPLSLQNTSCLVTPTPLLEGEPAHVVEDRLNIEHHDAIVPFPDDSVTTSTPSVLTGRCQVDAIEGLVQNLAEAIKTSHTMGLDCLESILFSFLNIDVQAIACGLVSPEILSSKIADQCESIGYRLFPPLDLSGTVPGSDSGITSATTLITRTFIFSLHERIQAMLSFWSRNGFPVRAHLLYYAARLAYESCLMGNSETANIDNNASAESDSGMPLLLFHINGYFSFQNRGKRDSYETSVSSSIMDKVFVNTLVENAFAAYKSFLMSSETIMDGKDNLTLSNLLCLDLASCSAWDRERTRNLFCSIFRYLADLCTGEKDIIKLLVNQLDNADLVDIQFEIGLKRFSIFSDNIETIFHLIKNSLSWDSSEQHKFWGLIRAELAVSEVQVEKIVLEFFYSDELDRNRSAIAVGGLLTLCSCRAPTPELVGAVMLLPRNIFQDFAAAASAAWVVSNASMLFDSLTKLSDKFDNKNGDATNQGELEINPSASLWLLNYFQGQGTDAADALRKFSGNTPRENST